MDNEVRRERVTANLDTIFNATQLARCSMLCDMRRKFDKGVEIDAKQRRTIVTRLPRTNTGADERITAALRQYEDLYEEVPGCHRPSQGFGMADSMVHAEAVYGHGWGRTRIKARSGLEEVAAFLWWVGGRTNADASENCHIQELEGGFRQILRQLVKVEGTHGIHHRDRLFVSEMSLVRVDEDTIIILKMPLKDEGQDMARNSVLTLSRASSALRGRHTFQTGNIIEAICLVRLGNDMTRVDCALKLEVGAGISQRTVLALIEKRLDEISEASIYFQVSERVSE